MTSFPSPFVSPSDGNPITYTLNGQPAVSSQDVALHFQKKHKEILRDIGRICSMCPKSFNERNFAPVEYSDAKGENRPCYLLTRDAFSILAMGFTGKAAILWKLRYIEAFNALEKAALENLSAQVIAARREALTLERDAEKTRQTALAEGASICLALSPLMQARLKKVLAYRRRGFSQREISAVINLHRRTVRELEKVALSLGLEARHAALQR
ncbi:MAG: Rha family transcriptional regulator [Deltaproteobacteria bacterium]|jgi:Rha family phage regulatory protein|nr:Rha family transcriptional regulator [Deltaproteobacteria bacterium]